MIRTLLSTILILFQVTSYADCIGKTKIELICPTDTVSTNSLLIVNYFKEEFDGSKAYTIVIRNEKKEIDLKFISSEEGFNQNQACFLIPATVQPGNYNISVRTEGDMTTSDPRFVYIDLKEIIIKKSVKSQLLDWKEQVHLLNASYEMFGCGDHIFYDLMIPNNFSDEYIYEVSLNAIDFPKNHNVIFITKNDKDKFSLGHDMCFGSLNIIPNMDYQVSIRAYSQKENFYSEAIEFQIVGKTGVNTSIKNKAPNR